MKLEHVGVGERLVDDESVGTVDSVRLETKQSLFERVGFGTDAFPPTTQFSSNEVDSAFQTASAIR